MTENVNSTTSTEAEELFDDATEAFPSRHDLAALASDRNPDTEGRLVAIWAQSHGTRPGERGAYTFVETTTLVLDDGPDGDQATELVGTAVPEEGKPGEGVRLDGFQYSTEGLVARLKPRVEGKNKAGVRLSTRPMLGRINTRKSTKVKGGAPAFSIAPATEDEKAWILEHFKDAILSINEEMTAKLKDADEQAAFG